VDDPPTVFTSSTDTFLDPTLAASESPVGRVPWALGANEAERWAF
jgi:hypothetical protein